MAHADYDCCAVCDNKMSYNPDAGSKEQLCARCAVELAKLGVFCHDVDELMAWIWIKSATPEELKRILDSVGYSRCFYPNNVDDLVASVYASQPLK